MENDGSLTPSAPQTSFAQNYNDGIGQGSVDDRLAVFGTTTDTTEGDEVRVAAIAPQGPLPRADVLSAIEATALRYAISRQHRNRKRLSSVGCLKRWRNRPRATDACDGP